MIFKTIAQGEVIKRKGLERERKKDWALCTEVQEEKDWSILTEEGNLEEPSVLGI